ncbi:MAG: hypothetical protein NUW37_10425 [Planctomycetes bacterium]|nr:hypothetical protein [Planctomycetota bacterium]
MIHEHVQMIDIDQFHWHNLAHIGKRDDLLAKTKRSWLMLIVDGDRTLKAVHSEKGTLLGYQLPAGYSLSKVKNEIEVDTVWKLERGFVRDIFRKFQGGFPHDVDYLLQLLLFRNTLAGAIGTSIVREPPLVRKPIEYDRIVKQINGMWPDGTSIAFYVKAKDHIHTSLILRKRSGEIDLMTTHDALRGTDIDPKISLHDFANVTTRAIEKTIGRVFAGIFMDKAVLPELRASKRKPRTFYNAMVAGEVILKNVPLRHRVFLHIGRLIGKI